MKTLLNAIILIGPLGIKFCITKQEFELYTNLGYMTDINAHLALNIPICNPHDLIPDYKSKGYRKQHKVMILEVEKLHGIYLSMSNRINKINKMKKIVNNLSTTTNNKDDKTKLNNKSSINPANLKPISSDDLIDFHKLISDSTIDQFLKQI